MALTVGELAVELDATDGRFRSSLREDSKQTQRFGDTAERQTKRAGNSFKGLGATIGKFTGIIGALSAALATVGAVGFLSGGLRAAAEFEQIGIALEVLTGNAEGAKQVLADVNRLVVQTPFGLGEVASAARSVAVVFGENTEAVSEFTGIAADLAAAFGRPVEQIGENLSRAFSAGIGAADVFREAGITAEVKRITGATDLASISGEQLADALRQITSEGGKAFGAAAAQAESLGGALSNTSISFENLRRTFAEAFQGELVPVLVDVVQPAFQALEKLVVENKDEIAAFTKELLTGLVDGFVTFVKFTPTLFRALEKLSGLFDILRAVGAELQVQIAENIGIFGRFAAIPALVKGDLAEASRILREVEQNRMAAGEAARGVRDELLDKLGTEKSVFADLAKGADAFAATIAGVVAASRDKEAKATDEATEATTANTRANLSNVDALTQRTAAQDRLAKSLQDQVTAGANAGLSGAAAELAALDIQIAKVKELALNKQDEGLREERLLQLGKQRSALASRIASANDALPGVIEQVNAEISRIGAVDPKLAADFALQFQDAIISAAGDPVATTEALAGLLQTIRDESGPALSEGISEGLARTSFDGFFAALAGESTNFAQSFADVLANAVQPRLTEAFEESVSNLGSTIDGLLGGAFGGEGGLFGGKGGIFGEGGFFDSNLFDGAGELFGQGALGILSTGISAALKDDDITSTAGSVQSVVNSAERVRGIVAGPTSIAVAQVDRAISDSFVETNGILRAMLAVLERNGQAATGAAGSIASGGSDPISNILANESPSFV